MKERILDLCRNTLIVLLLCCIVVLTLMALPPTVVQSLHLPPEAMRLLGIPAAADPIPVRSTQAAAAQPLLISVRTQTGRRTAQRNFSALDGMFRRLTPFLGEGLQTAGAATNAELSEFREALTRPSAYFDYQAELPVSAIGAWLGAENAALTGSARRLLLSLQGDAVALYFLGGDCKRCATEISAEDFLEALAAFMPDGSIFAAEESADTAADPLTLRERAVSLPNAVAEIPAAGAFAESSATALNFNPYGAGAYTDANGNRVFTENSRTLSVAPDGTVFFTDSETDATGPAAAEDSVSAKIETARALLAAVDAPVQKDARLYLCGCEEEGDVMRCRFRYVLDGVPIIPDAASAVFVGQKLTELHFSARTCYTGVSRIVLLPLPQAEAIAGSGESLIAVYRSSARGTLAAGWIRN